MVFTCHACIDCVHHGDCTHEHTCDDSGERCETCNFECEEFDVDDSEYWDIPL